MIKLMSFKVIIAGGRDFNDYKALKEYMNNYLEKYIKLKYRIFIVSGRAKGADSLGEKYAKEHGFGLILKPANWDKYGKRAGYLRNSEMADIANACVAFWDGKSRGTKHMIDLAKKKQIFLRVVRY